MEELLEMITWSQLGIHKKPVTYLPFMISDEMQDWFIL